jgi:hypothetical protein
MIWQGMLEKIKVPYVVAEVEIQQPLLRMIPLFGQLSK